LAGSVERGANAVRAQATAQSSVRYENDRERPEGQPVEGLEKSLGEAEKAGEALTAIEDLLEQMQADPAQASPELQQAARQRSQRQQQLSQRQQELSREVEIIEQSMPTGDGTAQDAMQRAGEAMNHAEKALQQGQAMAGEGHQRDAQGQIGTTRRTLERQMAEYQQMQQSMQQMKGEQSQGHGTDKGQSSQQRETRIEIPAPEAFQYDEQYRQELLEGMEADVPEEYQALKRRYYEELVRQ
ncbi:MAG: hypothetical protein QGG40_22065, partial [Myxococcota bacterium]|nr:hypothetical protein [Myxococcota bacterium]